MRKDWYHYDEEFTPIFDNTIEAFAHELELFFSATKKTPTFLLKMQDDLKAVKDQDSAVKPPFFTYRLNDTSINDEGFPAERMARMGIHRGGPKSRLDPDTQRPIDPNLNWKTLYPIPVIISLSIEYHCDAKRQIHFAQAWLYYAVKKFRCFELAYDDMVIPVDAVYDRAVTYSDVDYDNDSLVSCQTNATLYTYIAKEKQTRPISRYTLNESIIGTPENRDTDKRRVYTDQTLVLDQTGLKKVDP